MRISISGESQELSDYINVIKEVVEETCDNLINILKVMEKEWKLKYKTKKISLKRKIDVLITISYFFEKSFRT